MMDDWDDEDIPLDIGHFLNPLPSPRRGIRRNGRSLGNSDLREIMSLIAFAADELYYSNDEDSEEDIFSTPRSSQKDHGVVKPLLDLCAKAVAKTCTCEQLELHDPPLDEALLRKVAFWAFPQDEKQVRAFANLTDKYNAWDRGWGFYRDKRIKEMWQVGFMATAYLSKYVKPGAISGTSYLLPSPQGPSDSSDIRVSLTFEQQKIVSSTCSECKNDVWCSHIIAAIIFRINNCSQVRVHAPMTETLSTLDRNQLQKLLQYAVNEDPAGILGKVFKHVDAVRDSSSEISALAGAPDPTFGRSGDALSQWQLSLQWLSDTLTQELDEMTSQRIYEYSSSSSYYPDSYDMSEKMDSRMYNYMGKVFDLARQQEMESAAEVLIRVTQTVLQRMDSVSQVESPCLSRFAHDLIHVFTVLILYRHTDQKARNKLVAAAKKFNEKRVLIGHKINNSEWAELPPIQLCFTAQVAQHSKGLFVEPIAAELASTWSTDLQLLLEGLPNNYDEDVVIMLARLGTLFHLVRNDAFPQIGRLCAKIIRKITTMASKLSILGSYIPENMDFLTFLRNGSNLNSPTMEVEAAAGPAEASMGKGRSRKRRACNKGKQPVTAKKAKLTKKQPAEVAEENLPLPKGQIVYGLFFSLNLLQVAQKKSRQEYMSAEHIGGACLLALELSHFRTVAPPNTVKLSEHNWLLKLELVMCEYLRSHVTHVLHSLKLYLDAYRNAPASYFGHTHPLQHVEAVLELCRSEFLRSALAENRRDDVVHLCASVLCHTHTMLDHFTLPTTSPFDIFIDSVSETTTERRKHRDFALRKLRFIAETLFSLISVGNPKHVKLVVKVLHQFERVENGALLKMVSKDIRLQLVKFEAVTELVEAALRFAIHAYKKTENLYLLRYSSETRALDREFIFSMARKIGVPSLKLFAGQWQSTFMCDDIRELLLMLEGAIKAVNPLPKDVVSLVTQYYEAAEYHSENACDLLVFCNAKMYQQCKAHILKSPHHYHVNALFELARREHTHSPTKLRSPVLNDKSFEVVQKALYNIRVQKKDINDKTYEFIDWMYEAIIVHAKDAKEMSNRPMFIKMVEAVSSSSLASHEVLLRILQNMGHTPNLLKIAAAPLAKALLMAYQKYFDSRYCECSHSTYAQIINEMHRARLHCKEYLKSGDKQFDQDVVSFVKKNHSGKKKLVKMLTTEFGSNV